MERKNITREGEKKKKKTHRREKKRMSAQSFFLSLGDKREILELIFNTINCLMKHNNLSLGEI